MNVGRDMTWVQVRFWPFVCVWVVVLILVFPRSGEWELRHGRLSCAAPAVHPVSGVSVVTPLLRVEVAESPRMARLITMCFQCFLRIRRWCIQASCGRADYRFSSMKRSCTATRMR